MVSSVSSLVPLLDWVLRALRHPVRAAADEAPPLGWSCVCLALAFTFIPLALALVAFAFAFPLVSFALPGLGTVQLLLVGILQVPGCAFSTPAVIFLSRRWVVGLIGPQANPRPSPLDIPLKLLRPGLLLCPLEEIFERRLGSLELPLLEVVPELSDEDVLPCDIFSFSGIL